ncbi:MAG TPA: acyltransferase [Acidimicrobiales bacterium]|jgi:peptidoglycan/LPS O-acetylase OafA/YrhL
MDQRVLVVGGERIPIVEPGGANAGTPLTSVDAPTAVTGQYLPALDGLRAFAVAGVFAYHLGFGWASGGYLGVDLFFVLSGFLITSLLLEEWVTTARIRLGSFWARRARRLLPALFLVLVAIAVYVVLNGRFGPPGSAAQVDLSGLRGDDLATLFYVANWHAIFAHQSYFAQFSAPSPLEHTWSLAIEEQFYLVWPPVLLLILTLARGAWRRVGMIVTVVGALASAGLMALLYHPAADPTRLYFGTDTHAFDMLAGATIAMIAAARPQPGRRARLALHVAAPLAAVALGVFWVTAGTTTGLPKGWMFQGGFLVCAVLAAIVIADARQFHQGPLAAVLSTQPLRWIGMISYGIYLWHWPIIVYLNGARTGWPQPWLDLARVGLTLVLATASYYLVERPIRQRRLHGWPRFALAPVAAVVTAAIVVVATIPAVAAPTQPTAAVGKVAAIGGSVAVAGSGGVVGRPITLPAFGPGDPLRVSVLGDSLAHLSEPGIAAALGATGEVTVSNSAFTGFGLNRQYKTTTGRIVTGFSWLQQMIGPTQPQIVLATWSWDGSCTANSPTPLGDYKTYTCAHQQPIRYKAMLEKAVRLMLTEDGAAGVIFLQFPLVGPDIAGDQTPTTPSVREADAGNRAWNQIVASMPAEFPGKVMYLPVASSVLLNGSFTSWLPPVGQPQAPKSTWVRVRFVDGVHMCPSGIARYADAILADLTSAYHLPSAVPGWAAQSWTDSATFDGVCPDDHPTSG